MIEIRVVDNGLMCRPDFQYRYHLLATDGSGALHPPNSNNMWSEWQTAEWIKADDYKEWIEPEETQND